MAPTTNNSNAPFANFIADMKSIYMILIHKEDSNSLSLVNNMLASERISRWREILKLTYGDPNLALCIIYNSVPHSANGFDSLPSEKLVLFIDALSTHGSFDMTIQLFLNLKTNVELVTGFEELTEKINLLEKAIANEQKYIRQNEKELNASPTDDWIAYKTKAQARVEECDSMKLIRDAIKDKLIKSKQLL